MNRQRTLGRMPRRELVPESGLFVSRLGLGLLTMGPLQRNRRLQAGRRLVDLAFSLGINLFDTAEYYRNYSYLKGTAVARQGPEVGGMGSTVLVSRSYAATYEGMRRSLARACAATGRRMIDVFMLHEQESALTLRGHEPALKCLVDAREQGLIRYIGVSTHHVAGVLAAARRPEIDLISPVYNIEGWGIVDGTVDEMSRAISEARRWGKGVYAIKALAGGHLIPRWQESLDFVLANDDIAAVVVGMASAAEVLLNVGYVCDQDVDPQAKRFVRKISRRLIIDEGCDQCGCCIERCPQRALYTDQNGRIVCSQARCVLCGYCAGVCRRGAIKVV